MAYDRRQAEVGVPVDGAGGYRDYHLEIGRAEVPVGQQRGFEILGPGLAANLGGWVECLIPGVAGRPSAAEVGAAEYIDASVAKAPSLRETLLRALDRLAVIAATQGSANFAEASIEARSMAVRELELADRSGAFEMVRDFTYEAYYGHPKAIAALHRATGWEGVAPTTGSQMAPFDEGLLARIKQLPPHFRGVSE